MSSSRLELPLAAPSPTTESALVPVEVRRFLAESPPPPAATDAKHGGGILVVVAMLAVAALVVITSAWWGGDTAAPASASTARGVAPVQAPRTAGHPEWPKSATTAELGAWQPAVARFADGSTAAVYPDRVRAPAGRAVRVFVERRDAGGEPVTGILDMELIVSTPGRAPFKAGFAEDRGAPGTYKAVIADTSLGIGRTDFQLVASQTGRPRDTGGMASATAIVEIVGGVRFAGPPVARWEDDRLVIDLPVSTRTAAHAVVRAELRAGDEVLGELVREADIPEGDGVVTLDAGTLIRPGDARLPLLAIAEGTVMTTDGGTPRWTDFWRGARPITVR